MSDYDGSERPVIRDKRRIDPLTGEVRQVVPESEDPLSPAWSQDQGAEQARDSGGHDDEVYEAYEEQAPPDDAGRHPAGPTAAYTEQATAAYAEQAAAYAQSPEQDQPSPASDELASARQELSERTADLQRLLAEYTNYRRRVERDRASTQEQALVTVLSNLLPLLDDVARARDHGDLTGGFRSVGEALEATVEKLGLARFGEPGEPFDPMIHEALTHSYSPDVTAPTAVAVLQPGYRLGERVLRPARVAVAEPE